MDQQTIQINLEIENKLNVDNSIESWSWKTENIKGSNEGIEDTIGELHLIHNLGRFFYDSMLLFPTLPNLQDSTLQQYIVKQTVFDSIDLPYTEQVFCWFHFNFYAKEI